MKGVFHHLQYAEEYLQNIIRSYRNKKETRMLKIIKFVVGGTE